MSLVRVHDLGRSFRCPDSGLQPVQALEGVTFTVDRGECVGLIGRNGSGKTTLLRILAGVLTADQGAATVDGQVAALIEAGGGIELDSSGRENLRNLLVLQRAPLSRLDGIMARAIDFAQLGEFIDAPVRIYSSGMLMRLSFAAVIFLEADLLLVDEVLSVGDPVFQRRCAREIRSFVERGGTMILASHNYHEVANLCERVILLEGGRIVMEGASEDVFRAFWQRNEHALSSITPTAVVENLLKAHAPLAQNTGEMRIKGVRFVNGNGVETLDIRALEPLRIDIDYQAAETVTSPLCRVQFHRADGLFVMGSNTYRHGLWLGSVHGCGTIRLSYPSFPLAEGEYYVSVGLWPDEYRSFIAEQAFDFHEHAYVLKVSQQRTDGGGVIASRHQWSVVDG